MASYLLWATHRKERKNGNCMLPRYSTRKISNCVPSAQINLQTKGKPFSLHFLSDDDTMRFLCNISVFFLGRSEKAGNYYSISFLTCVCISVNTEAKQRQRVEEEPPIERQQPRRLLATYTKRFSFQKTWFFYSFLGTKKKQNILPWTWLHFKTIQNV